MDFYGSISKAFGAMVADVQLAKGGYGYTLRHAKETIEEAAARYCVQFAANDTDGLNKIVAIKMFRDRVIEAREAKLIHVDSHDLADAFRDALEARADVRLAEEIAVNREFHSAIVRLLPESYLSNLLSGV